MDYSNQKMEFKTPLQTVFV